MVFSAVGEDVSAVASPTNDGEAKRLYIEEVQKREAAERKNLALKKKLASIQHKKDGQAVKFSEFGKQGGRENTK